MEGGIQLQAFYPGLKSFVWLFIWNIWYQPIAPAMDKYINNLIWSYSMFILQIIWGSE